MEEQTNRRPENLCRVPILQVDQRDKIKCIINIFFLFTAPTNVVYSVCNLLEISKNVYDTSIAITDVFS